MKDDRYFFKLNGIPLKEVVYELNSRGVTHKIGPADEFASEYLVGYPGSVTPTVYAGNYLYETNRRYTDYAFRDLYDFVRSVLNRGPYGTYEERGSDWEGWPYAVSYNTYRHNTPFTEPDKEMNQQFASNRPTLFRVAAVFYPQYPEGAVVDLENAEYPKIVLQPQIVLARSREEAITRMGAKVEEGYLDRQDGTVEFLVSNF